MVKAISKGQQDELLYKRWVDRNRAFVDSISGGRIAYVHVKGMNSPSFRTVYSELLSAENRVKDAVIVDERHNGGRLVARRPLHTAQRQRVSEIHTSRQAYR